MVNEPESSFDLVSKRLPFYDGAVLTETWDNYVFRTAFSSLMINELQDEADWTDMHRAEIDEIPSIRKLFAGEILKAVNISSGMTD